MKKYYPRKNDTPGGPYFGENTASFMGLVTTNQLAAFIITMAKDITYWIFWKWVKKVYAYFKSKGDVNNGENNKEIK